MMEKMDGLNSAVKQLQSVLDVGVAPNREEEYEAVCSAILEHGVFPTLPQV